MAAVLMPLSAEAQMRSGGGRMGGGASAGFRSGPHFAGPGGMAPRGFGAGAGVSRGFGVGLRPIPMSRPGFASRGFAPRGFAPRSSTRTRFGRGFGFGSGFDGDFDRDDGFRDRDRFFHHRHGRFLFSDFGFGYYAAPYGYGYPAYADYASPSYNQYAAAPDTNAINQAYQQGALEQQVTDLSNEVSQMRAELESPRAANAAPSRSAYAAAEPAITLVFRDGHRSQAQNYAIAGSTFWILNQSAAKKVPMSELDLAATRQVNQQNGIELEWAR